MGVVNGWGGEQHDEREPKRRRSTHVIGRRVLRLWLVVIRGRKDQRLVPFLFCSPKGFQSNSFFKNNMRSLMWFMLVLAGPASGKQPQEHLLVEVSWMQQLITESIARTRCFPFTFFTKQKELDCDDVLFCWDLWLSYSTFRTIVDSCAACGLNGQHRTALVIALLQTTQLQQKKTRVKKTMSCTHTYNSSGAPGIPNQELADSLQLARSLESGLVVVV